MNKKVEIIPVPYVSFDRSNCKEKKGKRKKKCSCQTCIYLFIYWSNMNKRGSKIMPIVIFIKVYRVFDYRFLSLCAPSFFRSITHFSKRKKICRLMERAQHSTYNYLINLFSFFFRLLFFFWTFFSVWLIKRADYLRAHTQRIQVDKKRYA